MAATNMKPRGFWGTWAVIAAKFAILVIVIAVAISLLIGLAATLVGEGSFSEWLSITAVGVGGSAVAGVGFGLLYGFLNAFNYKASTISVTFQVRDDFLSRLTAAINELGFRPESRSQNALIYKRDAFREKLKSPRISVQIEQDSATIVGPALYIRRLRRQRLEPSHSLLSFPAPDWSVSFFGL